MEYLTAAQLVIETLLKARGYQSSIDALSQAVTIPKDDLCNVISEINISKLAQLDFKDDVVRLHLSLPVIDIKYLLEKLGKNAIHYLPVTTSTNSWCFEHLDEDFEDGVVVVSDCQVSGRGRFGRVWVSPMSQFIYSQAFHVDVSVDDFQGFSECLGNEIVHFLKQQGVSECRVKWPNDIYVNQQKMGGILCEIRPFHGNNLLVVGIGMNLKLPDGIQVGQEATSLYLYQKISKERLIIETSKMVKKVFQHVLNHQVVSETQNKAVNSLIL